MDNQELIICARCRLCIENCYACKYLSEEPFWHCNTKLLLNDFEKIRLLSEL